MICLPKNIKDAFLDALKNGDLDVNALADMKDSAARRAEFDRVLGKDYGQTANTFFENGLMKEDQEAGLIAAVKQMAGLSDKAKQDYIAKISSMDRLLSPSEEKAFLADAVNQKLGVAVSQDQAKTLFTLAKKMDAANPANRGEVKNIGDLLDEIGKMPDLTESQKSDIDAIKAELNRQPSPDEVASSIRIKMNAGNTEIGPEVQDLARSYIAQGITDPEKLVEAVHAKLKETIPGITTRETMDAISGYGDYRQLSQDEVGTKLSDLKGQMQNLAKLDDMQNGEAPKKTGSERRAPSDEERRLIQQVNEAKKKGGYDVKDPETQLKTALDSVKSRLKNQISDLETQIASGEKTVREQRSVDYDKEASDLKARRDDLKSQFDKIFGKTPLTDAQRVSMASKLLDRQIETLQSDLKEGNLYPAKPESKTPVTPELEAKRATLESLRAEREELRNIANPKATPEEKALAAYKARTAAKIEELQNRLDTGDFSPVDRSSKPIVHDDESANLKADLDRVKDIIQNAKDEQRAQEKQLTKDAIGKLQKLVKNSFGKDVPPEVQSQMDALKAKYQDENVGENLLGTSAAFINAQHEFSDYVHSLDEKPAWASIRDSLSNIYKNLFIGVKTGVKTTVLGTLNSAIEVVNRRIATGKVMGNVDLELKRQAVIANIKLGWETGSNSFINTSSDDASVFGANKHGHSEEFGHKDTLKEGNAVLTKAAEALNKTSRAIKYVAIDVLHKAPMMVTSSLNFADALDITASTIAKMDYAQKQGMDANAIFKDAVRVEPETTLGKIARNRAQQEMFRTLNLNNTALAEATSELQRAINKQVPTLGNYLIPMAKVPSSIISNQIENFGGGLATGTIDVVRGLGDLNELKKSGQESTPEGVQAMLKIGDGVRTLTRTVGIIGAAALLVSNLTKKDFYQDTYGNAYVKMGDYWLNTQAFGGAGAAITGTMMAKTGVDNPVFDYSKAAFEELKTAPLIDSLDSAVQSAESGKLLSSLVNSYLNPIFAQDIEKSLQQQSLNPALVGSLIRTVDQKAADDATSKAKAAATRKRNAAAKAKTDI